MLTTTTTVDPTVPQTTAFVQKVVGFATGEKIISDQSTNVR